MVMLCEDCCRFLFTVITLIIVPISVGWEGFSPLLRWTGSEMGKGVFGLSRSTCIHLHCFGSGMLP